MLGWIADIMLDADFTIRCSRVRFDLCGVKDTLYASVGAESGCSEICICNKFVGPTWIYINIYLMCNDDILKVYVKIQLPLVWYMDGYMVVIIFGDVVTKYEFFFCKKHMK